MPENPDKQKFQFEYPVDEKSPDASHNLFLFGSRKAIDEYLIKCARDWFQQFTTSER